MSFCATQVKARYSRNSTNHISEVVKGIIELGTKEKDFSAADQGEVPGVAAPPYFQTKLRLEGPKKCFLGDHPPPPPPYLKVWIRDCFSPQTPTVPSFWPNVVHKQRRLQRRRQRERRNGNRFRLAEQQNLHVHRAFFVPFFAVAVRLRRASAYFYFFWGM